MSLATNATHVLDDFLEVLETLPLELRTQLEVLASKDVQFEEARKALFKKRNLFLRAEEKGLDSSLQAALLRKTEKEHSKLLTIIDEKIEIETKLENLIALYFGKLEGEMVGKLGMNLENPYTVTFADIPDAEQRSEKFSAISIGTGGTSGGGGGGGRSRSSPKKRQTLNDEPPIDPNEPVYCYCKQVSYGDMVACDNPNCSLEWFHYPCVGLTTPPKGKWFCKDCRGQSHLTVASSE